MGAVKECKPPPSFYFLIFYILKQWLWLIYLNTIGSFQYSCTKPATLNNRKQSNPQDHTDRAFCAWKGPKMLQQKRTSE